jgi:PAS domain-containing protein
VFSNCEKTYKTTFEPLAAPAIIYNRHGVIYYVNPAYKALTHFSMPLPTSRADYTFFRVILIFLVLLMKSRMCCLQIRCEITLKLQ